MSEDSIFPKITIVTPSLNQVNYLEQTVQSILDQNYPALEYIIIDGGSTDGSLEIIKTYSDRLAHWVSETDNGQAHAINKGLQKATGVLFNWINADDYLEEGALFSIAETFLSNPGANVICGYTRCFFDDTGETSHSYRMGISGNVTETVLQIEMNQPGSFYRTSVLHELGGINETLNYVFDDELWIKYLSVYAQKSIVQLDSIIAHFRLHGNSKTIKDGFSKFRKERNAIYLSLLHQMDAPRFLLRKLANSVGYTNYTHEAWSLNHLDPERFMAYFADRYMFDFYKDHLYSQAKWSMKQSFRFGYWKWSYRYVALFVKLFIIPPWLIQKLRYMKQHIKQSKAS